MEDLRLVEKTEMGNLEGSAVCQLSQDCPLDVFKEGILKEKKTLHSMSVKQTRQAVLLMGRKLQFVGALHSCSAAV